jgi:HEXXH motif-containing protein
MRRSPKNSVTYLCGFLNGEWAFENPQFAGPKRHWTVLGDFCSAASVAEGTAVESRDANNATGPYHALRFAGSVPIDFHSPNHDSARETGPTGEYLAYSADETVDIRNRLEDAYRRICIVSEVAGSLVSQFIKVLMAFKDYGYGSTSQCDVPGRVLLGGIGNTSPARLAEALVHEAIHQFLYVLEYKAPFVVDFPRAEENITITSGWSGRGLDVYAYIQACFVWYGLSNFWGRAAHSDAFDATEVQQRLSGCLAGFRVGNPLDQFGGNAGVVRFDVMRTARSFEGRLRHLLN